MHFGSYSYKRNPNIPHKKLRQAPAKKASIPKKVEIKGVRFSKTNFAEAFNSLTPAEQTKYSKKQHYQLGIEEKFVRDLKGQGLNITDRNVEDVKDLIMRQKTIRERTNKLKPISPEKAKKLTEFLKNYYFKEKIDQARELSKDTNKAFSRNFYVTRDKRYEPNKYTLDILSRYSTLKEIYNENPNKTLKTELMFTYNQFKLLQREYNNGKITSRNNLEMNPETMKTVAKFLEDEKGILK